MGAGAARDDDDDDAERRASTSVSTSASAFRLRGDTAARRMSQSHSRWVFALALAMMTLTATTMSSFAHAARVLSTNVDVASSRRGLLSYYSNRRVGNDAQHRGVMRFGFSATGGRRRDAQSANFVGDEIARHANFKPVAGHDGPEAEAVESSGAASVEMEDVGTTQPEEEEKVQKKKYTFAHFEISDVANKRKAYAESALKKKKEEKIKREIAERHARNEKLAEEYKKLTQEYTL